jgi:hypothetical protein
MAEKEPSFDLVQRGTNAYVIQPRPGVTRVDALTLFLKDLVESHEKKENGPHEQS